MRHARRGIGGPYRHRSQYLYMFRNYLMSSVSSACGCSVADAEFHPLTRNVQFAVFIGYSQLHENLCV